MKRFVTIIPLQNPKNLHDVSYESFGGEKMLTSQLKTRFPILIPIDTLVEKGEEIAVTAICIGRKFVKGNYEHFKAVLSELAESKGFLLPEENITVIEMADSEDEATHMKLFKDMSYHLTARSNEEIYADMTYGTKPMPMIIMMALTYAHKFGCDSSVEAVIYASYDEHSNINRSKVYDVTSLFYMNSAVNNMANLKISDPMKLMEGFMT